MFYYVEMGFQLRMLPSEFPSYSIVCFYCRSWSVEGVWEYINQSLARQRRQKVGKYPLLLVVVIDSQPVKITTIEGGRASALYKVDAPDRQELDESVFGKCCCQSKQTVEQSNYGEAHRQ